VQRSAHVSTTNLLVCIIDMSIADSFQDSTLEGTYTSTTCFHSCDMALRKSRCLTEYNCNGLMRHQLSVCYKCCIYLVDCNVRYILDQPTSITAMSSLHSSPTATDHDDDNRQGKMYTDETL